MTVLVVIATTCLTSCYEQSQKGEQLTTMIKVRSTQDLIDVCDIEITYKGKGGINTIDTISTTDWNKIVVNDSFPTKIGVVAFRYLIKPGFKPAKATYDLQHDFYVFTKEQEYNYGWYPLYLMNVPADKVESFLDLRNFQGKDIVELEADTNVINSGIVKVSRTKQESSLPFVFEQ